MKPSEISSNLHLEPNDETHVAPNVELVVETLCCFYESSRFIL